MNRTFLIYIVFLWAMFLIFAEPASLVGGIIGFIVVFCGGAKVGFDEGSRVRKQSVGRTKTR